MLKQLKTAFKKEEEMLKNNLSVAQYQQEIQVSLKEIPQMKDLENTDDEKFLINAYLTHAYLISGYVNGCRKLPTNIDYQLLSRALTCLNGFIPAFLNKGGEAAENIAKIIYNTTLELYEYCSRLKADAEASDSREKIDCFIKIKKLLKPTLVFSGTYDPYFLIDAPESSDKIIIKSCILLADSAFLLAEEEKLKSRNDEALADYQLARHYYQHLVGMYKFLKDESNAGIFIEEATITSDKITELEPEKSLIPNHLTERQMVKLASEKSLMETSPQKPLVTMQENQKAASSTPTKESPNKSNQSSTQPCFYSEDKKRKERSDKPNLGSPFKKRYNYSSDNSQNSPNDNNVTFLGGQPPETEPNNSTKSMSTNNNDTLLRNNK